MKKKLKFYINNMMYTINADEELIPDIEKFLPIFDEKNQKNDEQLDTGKLLLAYMRRTQEFYKFKKDIEDISDKLPPL